MNPTRWDPRTCFLLSIAAAAVAGAVIVVIFGEENFLVELAAGFGAALLAFSAALAWERDRELRELEAKEAARHQHQLEETVQHEDEMMKEIKRLLPAISTELEKNAQSLEYMEAELARLESGPSGSFVHPLPLLFDGVWIANAPRLFQLLDYPGLIGGLGNLYGTIEEIRFRVRSRTQLQTYELDAGIEELLHDATDMLEKLRPIVETVAEDPIVGPLRLRRPLRVGPPLGSEAQRRTNGALWNRAVAWLGNFGRRS